jgi:large conductance mechanosensitive channel
MKKEKKDRKKNSKAASNFFIGFKDFIAKGNVIDLAVAVVIGAAFGAIVNSFVNDIIMPLISSLFGGATVDQLFFVIPPAPWADPTLGTVLADGTIVSGTPIFYGRLIQAILNFFIIALFIYIFIKFLLQHKQYKENIAKKEAALEASKNPPSIPQDIQLLTEIRDLLLQQNSNKNKE